MTLSKRLLTQKSRKHRSLHRGEIQTWRRRSPRVEALESRRLLTTYLVDTFLDSPAALVGDVDGAISLREAINAASSNAPFGDAPAGEGGGLVDTISFDPSLSGQTIVLDGEELVVSDNLSINGLGQDDLTISGNDASGVFWLSEPSISVGIADLTIADGYTSVGGGIANTGMLALTNTTLRNNTSDGNGGGIFNEDGASVIISHSILSGNSAGASGGAISNYAGSGGPFGTLSITDTVLSENSAGSGGAIWNDGPASITSSSFLSNTARILGGGIAHARNEMTINESTLANNDSGFFGGGIDNSSSGVLKITNSTLSGNSTGSEGGAIENFFSTLELTNSTLSGNSSNRQGGGIFNLGELKITNSTLTLNRADADGSGSGTGGGLHNIDSSSRPSPVLNNTIIAGNLRGLIGGDIPDDISGTADLGSSHNLIGDPATAGGLTHGVSGNIIGTAGSSTIDITTVLDLTLSDNGGPTLTHALVSDGPAVNAGDNSLAVDAGGDPLKQDQRGDGFARIVDTTVDIGSFELPQQVQVIDIDVKPGSDPNSINLASNGVIAVSILTTDDFNATLVDANTVQFADAGAVHHSLEDVDGDGDLDMVLHFRVHDTNLAEIYAELLSEDSESNRQSFAVSLTGATLGGTSFTGSDGVDMFFSGKALRDLLNELALGGVL